MSKTKPNKFVAGSVANGPTKISMTEIVVPFAVPGRIINKDGRRWICKEIDIDAYRHDIEIFVTSTWQSLGQIRPVKRNSKK